MQRQFHWEYFRRVVNVQISYSVFFVFFCSEVIPQDGGACVAIVVLSPGDICQTPTYEYLSLSPNADLSNLIDSTVAIACTQNHCHNAGGRFFFSGRRDLYGTHVENLNAWICLSVRWYKQCTMYKYSKGIQERRLLTVAMAVIQMTESEMSCDGCYHHIQVTR